VHERAADGGVRQGLPGAPRNLRRPDRDRKAGQTALTVDIDGRAPLALRWGGAAPAGAREGETVTATLVPVRGGGHRRLPRGEGDPGPARGVVGLILDGRGGRWWLSGSDGWRVERGRRAFRASAN